MLERMEYEHKCFLKRVHFHNIVGKGNTLHVDLTCNQPLLHQMSPVATCL